MANGIAIKDVTNKLQGLNGEEVIPISTGADEPEVVEVDTLKEYINEDVDTALEGKQDVINDLATIRSGAALGATALQSYTESDPTVHDWAKAEQKPSYTASEVGAVPTTRKINNKALSSDITLTATDVDALPSSTVIPAAQIQSDWNQSNTSAKDYIKNKPEIPVLPTLADVATSGDYEDLTNTPTIPDVPEWAMSSTKPSYTVSEIDGAQEELVSGTNIKTINGTSILGSGNITIQGGGGGDVNVIESITFNGSAVPVDGNKNAAITYTETEPDFNGSAAATITSADITAWNGKSSFSGSYNDLTDKPTIPTVPTNVSAFTNDAGYLTQHQSLSDYVQKSQTAGLIKNDGTIDTNTYLTQHQDISGKADKSEMSIVDGTGTDADKTTITLKTGTSATVLKSHQSLSGKQDVIDSSHKLSADLVDDSNTTNKFTNATEKQTWNGKQDALVSGTNIKTINNESLLGSGNITIQGGGGSQVQSDWNQSDNTAVDYIKNKPTIPVIPSNLAYTSNDNGEGIIPSDGIRAATVTSAATMTINPDVVTVIDGAVGTAAITLQVPQDNLAHVWDILLTTDSTVAITFAMSNSATILTPSGFSIGASKAVEISVIGVGTKYYLRYGEFA